MLNTQDTQDIKHLIHKNKQENQDVSIRIFQRFFSWEVANYFHTTCSRWLPFLKAPRSNSNELEHSSKTSSLQKALHAQTYSNIQTRTMLDCEGVPYGVLVITRVTTIQLAIQTKIENDGLQRSRLI